MIPKPKAYIEDPHFRVDLLDSTATPQNTAYKALHQCYSENYISDEDFNLSENDYGERVVNNCLKFGHWGVIEHNSFSFNIGYFPHNVLVQARTHRILSFAAVSMRYTSKRFLDYQNNPTNEGLEQLMYLRPVGKYADRQGGKYNYDIDTRSKDLTRLGLVVDWFCERLEQGMPEEQARDLLPSGYRQHFVMSGNLRAWLHFLDLRLKADAQPEIQTMSHMILERLLEECPEIVGYYIETRAGKARLSP